MPTVLRKSRYRFFFFSNEGQEPIHIHVESGEEHAKFWLEPIALASSSGYQAHELNAIRRIIFAHNEQFLRAWHEHFDA